MKKEMQEDFVPFKVAKILRELGYDRQCFATYENNKLGDPEVLLHISYTNNPVIPEEHKDRPAMFKIDNRNSANPQWLYSAPTYQQAFNWFEDEHAIFLTRHIDTTPNEILGITYTIKSFRFSPKTVEFKDPYDEFDRNKANLACIWAMIEIVKLSKTK